MSDNAFNDLANLADKATNECIRLRSRLAEAEALLRECADEIVAQFDPHDAVAFRDRIDAFLSRSTATDSSPVCSHDNCTSRSDGLTVTVICPDCGWHVTGVIGQPWPKAPDSSSAKP